MTAQVPYLAGLARRAAGPTPLQPPRPLFAGAARLPDRRQAGEDSADSPPGRAGDAAARGFPPAPAPRLSAGEQPAAPLIAPRRGTPASQRYGAQNRAGDVPAPTGPAVRAAHRGGPAAPAQPDRPGPAPVTLGPPIAAPGQPGSHRGRSPATPAPARPGAQPGKPLPAAGPVSPADGPVAPAAAASGRPPGASAIGSPWATPVELPDPAGRPPATGGAAQPAAAPAPPPGAAPGPPASRTPGRLPRRLPGGRDRRGGHRPAPARRRWFSASARPRRLDRGTGAGSGGRGRRPSAGLAPGPGSPAGRAGRARSVRVAPAAARRTGLGPRLHRHDRGHGLAASRPTLQPSESRSPAPVPRGRSRPPSLLGTTAGATRLRDGLRRWYGIAQG